MSGPSVDRSFSEPNLRLQCACGWEGHDDDVESWDVQQDKDRVVPRCPNCNDSVPEWGALRPISAAVRIARGPLRSSLEKAGYVSD